MVSGIAYDSEEARGIAEPSPPSWRGIAYKTSAEMAGFLGAFDNMKKTKAHARVRSPCRLWCIWCLRRFRNQTTGYQYKILSGLFTGATKAWDDAVQPKNMATATRTNRNCANRHIGLVMITDTTGVEPDFALCKSLKIKWQGFQIINQSVPQALV